MNGERRNESTDFFSRANAAIDLVDQFSADHLAEDDPGTRIQHLFVGSSVRLVLDVCMLTWTFTVYADAKVVWLVDFRYSRRKFRQGSELISGLVFPRGGGARVCRCRSVDGGERGDNGFGQRGLDCVCRAIVGSYGDVLPKSVVLFSEVWRKKEKRGWVRRRANQSEKGKVEPRSAISQSSSSTRRSSDWSKRTSSSISDNSSSSSSVAESTWSMYA
jgi:hypothetical protein